MKFGTSGLRGLVEDMTDTTCADYAAAFVRSLDTSPGLILIGRDLRPSSPRIAAACARGVATEGWQAVDCGMVPTPALALAAMRRQLPAIMVSGSHIPFDRNGLKFYRRDGEITKADEAAILAALASPSAATPAASATPSAGPDVGGSDAGGPDVGAEYVARGVDFVGRGALSGRRIGVWQHSAVGRDLLVAALEALGAEAVPLGRTDSFVPIDTEAVAAADAERIAAWVAEHRLDALVSTDGDGDRPLVADERGAVLRGDAVGMLTARLLGADGVATPLSSSTALERAGWPIRIERTRIGSPYVIEGLATLAAAGARLPVGYEANGGFLLGGRVTRDTQGSGGVRSLDVLPTRDALVPILMLLAGGGEGPLSGLVAGLPRRSTASDRLPEVPETVSVPLLDALVTPAGRARLLDGIGTVVAVDTLDGVRMTLDTDEIVHLRRSGNAPELRVYTEAEDEPRATALLARVLVRVAAQIAGEAPAA